MIDPLLPSRDRIAGRLVPRKRRARTYATGRICTHRGCTVVLSRYNSLATCAPHTPFTSTRVRGRRTDL